MYYLLMKQAGEGCDYTIECGTKVVRLSGETMSEALEGAVKVLDEHGCLDRDSDSRLKSCKILEVTSETPVDLKALMTDRQKAIKEAEKTQKEAAEKEEYERLKKKFEPANEG